MSDPTQPAPPAGGAPAPDAQPPAAPAAAAQPPAPPAPKAANPWARRPAPAAPAAAASAMPDAPKQTRGKVQVPARIAKELQLTRQQIAELKPVQKELEQTRAALGEYAKRELDGLSEQQRAYVLEHAGKNPALQLKMAAGLRALQPTAPAAPAKPSATTAPAATPTPTSTDPDIAAFQTWKALTERKAMASAAQFKMRNWEAIKRGETKAARH